MKNEFDTNDKVQLSRRSLLLGAAAGAATGFVAGCGGNGSAFAGTLSPPARGRHRTQVAVVGAGLAGIACARKLTARGVDVLVLEARGRVGGRIQNHSLGNGKVIEVGGQWVGPTQDRITALADAVGVGTYPTYIK